MIGIHTLMWTTKVIKKIMVQPISSEAIEEDEEQDDEGHDRKHRGGLLVERWRSGAWSLCFSLFFAPNKWFIKVNTKYPPISDNYENRSVSASYHGRTRKEHASTIKFIFFSFFLPLIASKHIPYLCIILYMLRNNFTLLVYQVLSIFIRNDQ